MNYSKIGSVEAIALIVVVILNHIVLNLPKNLINSCGSSTPLNVVFVSILLFAFLYIVIKLFNNFKGNDILDVSEFLGGKILKTIIGILFAVYFIIICGTQLRNFCEILKVVYFPRISIYFLVLVFLVVAIIANKFGSYSIIKCNLIVVPLVMINLVIAFFCVSTRFVPQRIFPAFGYGIDKTFFSGISNIFAFTGISYIYLIQPMLKDTNNFKKISFVAMIISALYVLFSVITLIFSFADVLTINEISPIYLLVRGANWGRFIQRPDAIFFLGWILCLMSYLSITIMFITRIFKKIGNLTSRSSLAYAVGSLIFIMALLPSGIVQIRFIENYVFKYYTIILVFIISFVILLLAYFKSKKSNNTLNTKEGDLINE